MIYKINERILSFYQYPYSFEITIWFIIIIWIYIINKNLKKENKSNKKITDLDEIIEEKDITFDTKNFDKKNLEFRKFKLEFKTMNKKIDLNYDYNTPEFKKLYYESILSLTPTTFHFFISLCFHQTNKWNIEMIQDSALKPDWWIDLESLHKEKKIKYYIQIKKHISKYVSISELKEFDSSIRFKIEDDNKIWIESYWLFIHTSHLSPYSESQFDAEKRKIKIYNHMKFKQEIIDKFQKENQDIIYKNLFLLKEYDKSSFNTNSDEIYRNKLFSDSIFICDKCLENTIIPRIKNNKIVLCCMNDSCWNIIKEVVCPKCGDNLIVKDDKIIKCNQCDFIIFNHKDSKEYWNKIWDKNGFNWKKQIKEIN